MERINDYLQKTGLKRVIIFAIILLVLIALRSMLNVILLTFIFSFLMDRLVELVTRKFRLHRNITVLLSYMTIIGLLTYGIVKYLPVITAEITQLFRQLQAFYLQPRDNILFNYVVDMIERNGITNYVEQGVNFILKSFTDISTIGIQVFISLILSLFFLLEKQKLIEFTAKFKNSKVADFYKEIEFFGKKFVLTFGKVLEAQFIIAVVNCTITTIALWIMDFPQLLGLSIMVFFLGLIPVAGVIISLIPLCTIAYTIGGVMYVVYILIVIMIIHAIEAYILNPKLMSAKTNLPVFYTFIVLIFGEHFFGVWGLIVGIPVFIFILDILGVKSIGNEEIK
ncbi:AI-2E family transporter [Robertmurraya andreesenii]|uniref:PurR-regulated permease PerM n=1 Tax=Anoxybacillus andreesenii TaxID=1325932 RepID=A0ABT9V411_9BACL|nr:AI-2E family transporter [Robertmurraya andreesenii]MDQ0155688.1 putative PurR-regulated permease PerM [Robertmurraya andreesenii]